MPILWRLYPVWIRYLYRVIAGNVRLKQDGPSAISLDWLASLMLEDAEIIHLINMYNCIHAKNS